MADSNLPVTPGSGTNVDGYVLDNGNFRQSVLIGSSTTATVAAPVDATKGLTVNAYIIPNDLCQSGTGASAAALTITLPAVASQFHYVGFIRIKKIFTAANVASATPLTVTSTNLPGSLTWIFGQPTGVIGNSDEELYNTTSPMKSSVAGTATTIVAPATAGILWHIAVHYYTAP